MRAEANVKIDIKSIAEVEGFLGGMCVKMTLVVDGGGVEGAREDLWTLKGRRWLLLGKVDS